jgi:hypothetical protein
MTDGDDGAGRARPFRRLVLYIPGFDPFPARRYRELYRTEGAGQARISGYELSVARGEGTQGWTARARFEGQEAEARIEVLGWSDIVRVSMGQGLVATYGQLARTVWTYARARAFWRLFGLRKGPMIAALYPVAVLAAELIVALVLAALVARMVTVLVPWPVAALIGLAIIWALLLLARRLDRRIFAWYLIHDYAFTASEGGRAPAALRPRLAEFAERIERALAEPWDEVLVVGHSSGAHLAVMALADLMRRRPLPDAPPLALLTLGQVMPMVTALKGASDLRADIGQVARAPGLTWVDVTAPGDGCSFALCDPVAVAGQGGPGVTKPLILSAAFSQTLSPERLKALRHRYFRLHFQYLCAFDRPGDYDYFSITAGPRTLADRFAGRRSSPAVVRTVIAAGPS